MAQDLLTLVANFKPGILARHAIFPHRQANVCFSEQPRRRANHRPFYISTNSGDERSPNRSHIIVQFVEKKTDVLVKLPTGFEKSLTKSIVCV